MKEQDSQVAHQQSSKEYDKEVVRPRDVVQDLNDSGVVRKMFSLGVRGGGDAPVRVVV